MTRYDMMMRGEYSSLEEMDEAYRKEEAGAKQRLAVMRAKGGLKMNDYISREEVLEHSEYTENFNLVVPVRFIKAMKAADVQTVKRGRWIAENRDNRGYADCYTCTNCNCYTYTYTLMKDCEYDYCPNCGARMEES